MNMTVFDIIKYFVLTFINIHNSIRFGTSHPSELSIVHVQYDDCGCLVAYESEGEVFLTHL